jgi:hypothetical protein
VAEGEVVILAPPEVQGVGVLESARIAVRRREQAEHDPAAADAGAGDLEVGRGDAVGRLDRAVVAQELLDRARAERRIILQPPAFARFVVVSCPAPRIRKQSESSSVSPSVCPWSSTATRALMRSSRGARLRSAKIACM